MLGAGFGRDGFQDGLGDLFDEERTPSARMTIPSTAPGGSSAAAAICRVRSAQV
jgi:hypothetical protein